MGDQGDSVNSDTNTDDTVNDDSNTDSNDWTVSSLSELYEAVQLSDQDIVLKAGSYSITDLPKNNRYFIISGDNNSIDLTDVYIDFPVDQTSEPHFTF